MRASIQRACFSAPLFLILAAASAGCGDSETGSSGTTTTTTTSSTSSAGAVGPLGQRDDLPVDQELQLDNLAGPVDVVRDKYGRPHIYATSIADARSAARSSRKFVSSVAKATTTASSRPGLPYWKPNHANRLSASRCRMPLTSQLGTQPPETQPPVAPWRVRGDKKRPEAVRTVGGSDVMRGSGMARAPRAGADEKRVRLSRYRSAANIATTFFGEWQGWGRRQLTNSP